MDPSDMLDFALGRLEGLECQRLQCAIACDPVLADRMCRLSRCVHLLLDDDWEQELKFGSPPIALQGHSRKLSIDEGERIAVASQP